MDYAKAIDPYSIKVPVFEGPFDLLLHLIRQNKIDIYDIPITLITQQYLKYIEMMKELDLEITSEFLVMAATLIYIKSRMLLPPDETVQPEQQEDPRTNLIQRLLEYQAYKEASVKLRERECVWINAFSCPPMQMDGLEIVPDELYLFDLNLFDLMGALKNILSKSPHETIRITRETLTVKDKIAMILEKIENEHTIKFEDIFAAMELSRIEIIIAFLALLEILRLGLARVYQDSEFGAIWIMRQEAVK